MREPVHWWDWAWLPIRAVEDPRTKPGHIALLLALRTAEVEFNELDDMDGGNFVTGQVYLPVTRSRLLELAGFGDADTLVRYRDDVAQFGYLEFTARSGLPSTYGIVSHWATNFDYHAHVAVPVAISRDTRLSPQAKALYAAFSVAAEYERQGDWPRQPDGNAHPAAPMYPQRCHYVDRHIRDLVGFRRQDQLRRYGNELKTADHLRIDPGRASQNVAELLTSQAAELEVQTVFVD